MQARKLVALLLIPLMAVPGFGNPAAVGIVQGSTAAMVRGANLVQGTTVYSGDVVDVAANGNAEIVFSGASQLMILQNSRIQLLSSAPKQPVRISVEEGYAKFRSTSSAPLVAMLADGTIRTALPDGIAAIHITNPHSALISAVKGNLLFSKDGSSAVTTVPEGMALSIQMTDDTSSPQAGSQAGGSTTKTPSSDDNSNHKNRKIVAAVIILGAALGIGLALASGGGSTSSSLSPFQP